MKNTIRSFAALGAAWNATHDEKHQIAAPAAKDEKPRKCRICGAEMEHISGSNVYVCHGMKTVPDKDSEVEGATKEVPCTNFALARA